MIELLAPAGSPEGILAAVRNGADAVYLGFGNFNARRNAKNFTDDDFAEAAEFCRVRGVKTYVTLNTLVTDRELPRVAEQAKHAMHLGADAILVQDLGVLRAVRQAVPEMPVHASTQMTVHNLEGVKVAAAMGLSRVVLSRELNMDEIRHICENSPIEIEVFGHGALCMCYSGQCYMSSVIGRRSGNRGLCAQPCRMAYSSVPNAREYPLSLKDNCLIRYIREMEEIGVKCIKLEGRMRRPEYCAVVTGIYSRAIRERRQPTAEEMDILVAAFSRDGFTDGYFTGKTGAEMFGVRDEEERAPERLFQTARKNYMNSEFQRVPVRFEATVRAGQPMTLFAEDDRGNTAYAEGAEPQAAFHREFTAVNMQTQLYKTGGTPFECAGAKAEVDPGLSVSVAAVNEMRRKVLAEIFEKRKYLTPRVEGHVQPVERVENTAEAPYLTVSVSHLGQLSKELAKMSPYVLYIPLTELDGGDISQLEPFLNNSGTTVCVTLPRIIHDGEKEAVEALLKKAKELGITEALCGNIGHILFARAMGFSVRGDYGLNIYNSHALDACRAFGLKSAALSFELMFSQIRDISKTMDTEMIVYGRLPLMITENCLIKSSSGACACTGSFGITDRNGFTFPVVREFGCRNVVLNSKKLFLADRQHDYMKLGLWGVRLMFTTENALECASVTGRYLGLNKDEMNNVTRGLYYRGVE